MGVSTRTMTKKDFFDIEGMLEQIQESDEWQKVSLKKLDEDMDDDLVYYSRQMNLAFQFIKDEDDNIISMKKVDLENLSFDESEKSI